MKSFNREKYLKICIVNQIIVTKKIEIFIIMLKNCGLPNVDEVYEKFINEEFHIENSYVFQLDTYAYSIVTDYIINVCNHIISRI